MHKSQKVKNGRPIKIPYVKQNFYDKDATSEDLYIEVGS